MRTIKFRAYDKIADTWCIGTGITKDADIKGLYHLIFNDQDSVIIDNKKTIGQFTGLKDKKNEDIYEGDICKSDKGTISFVVWSLDGWRMNSYYDGGDMGLYSSLKYYGIEIIGNIYENIELLK